jgi:hypothetical protein
MTKRSPLMAEAAKRALTTAGSQCDFRNETVNFVDGLGEAEVRRGVNSDETRAIQTQQDRKAIRRTALRSGRVHFPAA